MATLDVSKSCLVCADPLEFVALAPCSHKDVCSRCCARMISVLKDTRCVLCKQDADTLYVTRYMGDYTTRPDFGALQVTKTHGDVSMHAPPTTSHLPSVLRAGAG
jgi:hypothetical protein